MFLFKFRYNNSKGT